MRLSLQIFSVTLLFGALYVIARSLPDSECGFLHYQSPVVDKDGIEYCADSSSYFADLQKLKYPVTLNLLPETSPTVGQETYFGFKIERDNGDALKPHELAIAHTRLLHMMIIGPDSVDYLHVHPEPLGANGQWEFAFTPKTPGTYQVFAETVLNRTQQILLMNTSFDVEASDIAMDTQQVSTSDVDVEFDWQPTSLSTNTDNQLVLTFKKPNGEAVELAPVMGALAHVVAFDQERSGFAHLHPIYTGKETGDQPQLSFVFNTYKPGKYRLWAQYKIDDQERYTPIDVEVM